jgi:2-polyprenyl-6-methoxyphenol hydroxylase-like FAD-dependent oxidoreductase
MAGLFATALLRRAGWDARVYERTPVELFGRGAGITTQDELLQVLALCGASLRDLGITVHERIALNRNGDVVERLPFEQIVTSWDRLHQIMRATIPDAVHHLDHDLVSVEQTREGVIARFANGRVEHGDLLIGRTGIARSSDIITCRTSDLSTPGTSFGGASRRSGTSLGQHTVPSSISWRSICRRTTR